jgi:hypothetical protein
MNSSMSSRVASWVGVWWVNPPPSSRGSHHQSRTAATWASMPLRNRGSPSGSSLTATVSNIRRDSGVDPGWSMWFLPPLVRPLSDIRRRRQPHCTVRTGRLSSGDMTAGKLGPGPGQVFDNTTLDAVVVVPGIMGSELVDTATGDLLWGLAPGPFVSAWLSGASLARLHLSGEERQGRYGQVTASRLLRVPAWLPVLQGIEPYTRLVDRLRQVVADPAAVLEFPYDWRLPVAYNASRLAEAAVGHLESWRRHPAHEPARRTHPNGRPAKLVFVAHSMGGLLVRQATAVAGMGELVRASITLGTPLYGAPKAALVLSTGRGLPVPLPPNRPLGKLFARDADHGVRALARTLPGIYDLLPTYRCVHEPGGDGQRTARPLEVSDVVGLGGDRDLAAASATARAGWAALPLVGHELVLGKAQATTQGLTIADGVAQPVAYELREQAGGVVAINRWGDGTVPASSAELPGRQPWRLAQQHGSLARADDAVSFVEDVVREVEPELLGPPLAGDDGIGLHLPDGPVPAQVEWPAVITGLGHPRQATCTVHPAGGGPLVARPRIEVRDQLTQATVELPAPGLYRITLAGSGASPTSQLVLAVPAE